MVEVPLRTCRYGSSVTPQTASEESFNETIVRAMKSSRGPYRHCQSLTESMPCMYEHPLRIKFRSSLIARSIPGVSAESRLLLALLHCGGGASDAPAAITGYMPALISLFPAGGVPFLRHTVCWAKGWTCRCRNSTGLEQQTVV